jgi:hypothetical protein
VTVAKAEKVKAPLRPVAPLSDEEMHGVLQDHGIEVLELPFEQPITIDGVTASFVYLDLLSVWIHDHESRVRVLDVLGYLTISGFGAVVIIHRPLEAQEAP